jgi:nitrate reductase delta subunit
MAAARPIPYRAAVLYQAAARLLAYPDAELAGELPLLREALRAVGTPEAEALLPVVAYLAGAGAAGVAEAAGQGSGVAEAAGRGSGAEEAARGPEVAAAPADLSGLAAAYVATFDFTSRHCLHLTWWTEGDTRRRGAALVRFKEHYRRYGMDPVDGDLPDFLPVVLEFSAATRTDALLREHRPALELLRLALTENGTPYARVLEAVCGTLPGASPADRAQAMAMACGGPPSEEVGLVPYGHLGLLPLLTDRSESR